MAADDYKPTHGFHRHTDDSLDGTPDDCRVVAETHGIVLHVLRTDRVMTAREVAGAVARYLREEEGIDFPAWALPSSVAQSLVQLVQAGVIEVRPIGDDVRLRVQRVAERAQIGTDLAASFAETHTDLAGSDDAAFQLAFFSWLHHR
jgi:hypothetical protein